jgi:glycosyltransferase involved in cell wall biosynthesis
MTVLALPQPGTAPRQAPLDVEIVIPVYNEAPHLAERVTELRRFLDQSFPFRALVTVVDNASTDETFALASQLAAPHPVWRPCTCPARGGATHCGPPGRRAPPRWWPTWTSTCPRRSPPCSPSWRRSSRGRATWP